MKMQKFETNLLLPFALVAFLFSFVAGGAVNKQAEVDALRKMHSINQTEIKLGRLARAKGQSEATKNYGERLITDHEAVDKKVHALADEQNIDLTSKDFAVVEEHARAERAVIEKLDKTPANQFDAAFAKELESAHRNAAITLEKYEKATLGTKTAKLIRETLPSMLQHAEMAKTIERNAE